MSSRLLSWQLLGLRKGTTKPYKVEMAAQLATTPRINFIVKGRICSLPVPVHDVLILGQLRAVELLVLGQPLYAADVVHLAL